MSKMSKISEIIQKYNTLERLSYLFSVDDISKDDFCSNYKDHLVNSLTSLVKKPHLTDRILKNFTLLGSGTFGTVKKTNLNLDLVVKDNKNYIEDVNEIFINQVRINEDVIKNKNPNFPVMYSYILCKPTLNSKNERICTEDIIDISSYTLKDLDLLISKKEIKLYGIYEYIEGKTLSNYIMSLNFLKLTEEQKWSFIKSMLIQIFSGLDKLSQSGNYTHFDLHPGNIIVNDRGYFDHKYILTDGTHVDVKDYFRSFIIDQGLSNIEYDGKFFVYETTYKHFLPIYDIYKLVTILYISFSEFDKKSKDSFHVKKLRELLINIFGNDSIIKYIDKNPKGDVITFMYHVKDEYITEIIDNMPYNDMVRLLLEDND